jgi:hypothetical protein
MLTAVVIGLVTAATTTVAIASQASAGSPPGTVAGVPATSSKVTVSGRGEFSNLKITVSQTRDIVNQAIGISWTGKPTPQFGEVYTTDFLQIMECWGNPVTDTSTLANKDNYVPANPGPPREQCEFGAGEEGSGLSNVNNFFAESRAIFYNANPTSQQQDNLYKTGEVPFRAVDGTVISSSFTGTSRPRWANSYYDDTTTNEIPFNTTFPDGTGSAVFQADTQLEAPGLGCGAPVPGTSTPPDCWLVIVPRGDTDINGQSLAKNTEDLGSPLGSVNWQNRIAIPLHYRPDSSPCPIGAPEHLTQGSALVTQAITSWQSGLCASSSTVIGYNQLSDTQTRQALTGGTGSGELGFVSQPVDPSAIPHGEQIAYAPVTLSGVTISFVIDAATQANSFNGPPITQVNLTPRLVAKLLTDSYLNANPYRLAGTGGVQGSGTPPGTQYATWLAKNPASLATDPDFLQYNPQFTGLDANGDQNLGDLMVELTGSDAASELWSWILADPSARAFLDGQPDPWGMTIDPYFSTSPKVNATGTGMTLPSDSYPSPDPWCGYTGQGKVTGQPPLCMTSFRPYTDSMGATAQDVLEGNTLQKIIWTVPSNPGQPTSYSSIFQIVPPGNRGIMGVTTTDSANRYGILDASLQNAAGKFVAPDTAGLLAGEAAMKPSSVPGVLAPNFASTSRSAYPLAMLTYAAVPLGTVAPADCAAYVALLNYAAGPGQVPGTALGNLPSGYVPLPQQLVAQTKAAAAAVAKCPQPPTTPASTPPGPSPSSSGSPFNTGSPSGSGSPSSTSPTGPGSTPGASPAGGPGGSRAVPSGGPAAVQQGLQLAGGTTPANPPVYGYALPIGAATGFLTAGAALLISRRRLQALRLLPALRLPHVPRQSRLPRSLRSWRPWRGSP